MTNLAINSWMNRPNLLRRFLVTKTLFQTLLRIILDVNHILIRGHNHISGMTEKVIDTPRQDMTYEHNGRSLVTCFMDKTNPHQSTKNGSKKRGFRTKPEQNNLKIVDFLKAFFKKKCLLSMVDSVLYVYMIKKNDLQKE